LVNTGSIDILLHRLDGILDGRFVDLILWDKQAVAAIGVFNEAHSLQDVFGA